MTLEKITTTDGKGVYINPKFVESVSDGGLGTVNIFMVGWADNSSEERAYFNVYGDVDKVAYQLQGHIL